MWLMTVAVSVAVDNRRSDDCRDNGCQEVCS